MLWGRQTKFLSPLLSHLPDPGSLGDSFSKIGPIKSDMNYCYIFLNLWIEDRRDSCFVFFASVTAERWKWLVRRGVWVCVCVLLRGKPWTVTSLLLDRLNFFFPNYVEVCFVVRASERVCEVAGNGVVFILLGKMTKVNEMKELMKFYAFFLFFLRIPNCVVPFTFYPATQEVCPPLHIQNLNDTRDATQTHCSTYKGFHW